MNEMAAKHITDFLEASSIIDGMTFEEAKELPKNDERFTYGALDGSGGDMVDLNFKSILVTVENVGGVANVIDDYEVYGEGGEFLGVTRLI